MPDIMDLYPNRVMPEPNSGCWIWLGSTNQRYGILWTLSNHRGRKFAHRYSYELVFGPIPLGKVICHRCDNPLCVNPHHLRADSQANNIKESYNKGRKVGPRGEQNGACKLTSQDILNIRSSLETHAAVARQYRVSASHISLIRRKLKWRHQ